MSEPRTAAPALAIASAAPVQPRPAVVRRSDALVPVRALGTRLARIWLPGLAWHVRRTGRPGLVGLALLGASALFIFSTHRPMVAEVDRLQSDVGAARREAAAHPGVAAPVPVLRTLPGRAEMPAVLGELLRQADAAQLTLDSGKYEISATKGSDVVRYHVSLPVKGPYPQVRQFLDATLKSMPAVAISELSFERKAIGDPAIEAQVRLTIFTRSTP